MNIKLIIRLIKYILISFVTERTYILSSIKGTYMPQFLRKHLSLDPNILDDAYDKISFIQSNKALSIIQISDLPSFGVLYDAGFIEDSLNSLLKAIEKIDGVKKAFIATEDRILIIHELHSNISFRKDISTSFLNMRKYLDNDSHSLALRYKCGTTKINSLKPITKESIAKAYLEAFAAASRAGLYNSNNHVFHDDYDETLSQLVLNGKLTAELQDAICKNRFKLGFQPVFDSITNEVAWFEVLLRLIDKNGDIKTSGPNIASAERLGFIQHIDEIILKLAISELAKDRSIQLSINISASSIDSPMFIENIHDLLGNNDISSRLIIEITETIAPLSTIKTFKNSVETLRKTGLRIALDDFGAGNTYIQQLTALEPDIIKIDGSLIKDLSKSSKQNLFIDLALQYSKEYNAKTVAECIENEIILNAAQRLKIDYLQGNYLGEVKLKR